MKHLNYTKQTVAIILAMLGFSGMASALSGSYTVGTGGNYTTLAAAVSDLTISGVTGPVTFNILSGTYSSTQVSVGAVSGADATNRVTFQAASGNAADVTITYAGSSTTNNYVFKLNGASFITLKNLTLNNSGSTYGTDLLLTGASSHDSVVGCVLTGNTGTSTSINKARIYADPLTGSHLVVSGCTIERGSYGAYLYGTSTSLTSDDHVFVNNNFSNNYYGYIYGYYLGNTTVKNNTCTASSVGTHYGVYFNRQQNGMTVESNTITTTGSGTLYGVSNYYYGNYYSGSSTTPLRVADNSISVISSGTTYGVYMYYYCYYVELDNNTIFSKSTSSGSTYGVYVYYYPLHCSVTDNEITTQGNNGTGYPFYVYYTPNNSSHYTCTGNTVTSSTTTGTLYAWYSYYHYNAYYENNTVSASTTSGTIYGYGPMYYNFNSRATNNSITYTKTSSGSIYNYGVNYYGTADTFDHNTVTINSTTSTVYNYLAYYGTGKVLNNTFNTNTTSGTLYNYLYYAAGALIDSNVINGTTTTGTNNGIYGYYVSSPSVFSRNTVNMSSNSGTVYGIYAYYCNGHKFLNNVVSTKTSGTNYTLQNYSATTNFYNNTFHSNATGSTNFAGYIYNASSTYTPILRNNVFSRSGTGGYLMYVYNSANLNSDYNLLYTQGTNYFQQSSPSINANNLQAWRSATGKEMNSLIYNPGYMDAANSDLRPDPSNASSWALQGRGVHTVGDTTDIKGNLRARTTAQGVPDIGAFEFTPTSTPPDATAMPAMPAANSTQTFTFGEDTVGVIKWGATVPSQAIVKQYTGTQAVPMPAGVGRMYFFADVQTPTVSNITYAPTMYYKNPWIGDVSSEANARIAKSSNGGTWNGYNFSNGITDTIRNTLTSSSDLDSMPSRFTGVENGRIGIRCVEAPKGLTHANITANAADVSWDPVFNPIGYQYVVDYNQSVAPPVGSNIKFSATNTVSLSGLTEDKTVYVHVRSICGPKDTSGWAIDSFMTLITCHAPDLKIASLSNKQAVVYWDSIKTAINYEYEISQSATPPTYGTPTSTASVLATYLKSGTTYYAHVRAFCNSMYSQSSWATTSFTTQWATNISGPDGESSGITVYPNPVKDILVVNINSATVNKNATLLLTDITGKILRTISVDNTRVEIRMETLNAGMYFIKYKDDVNTQIIKVNKQ